MNQPEPNQNQPMPASELNVLMMDGSVHTFAMKCVRTVTVAQPAVYLYDRDECAPAPGEHTLQSIEGRLAAQVPSVDEWNCPHCGGPDQPGHDLHRKCGDYAEEEALHDAQTTLCDFDPITALHDPQKVALGLSNPARRPNHPGRGNHGTFNHCSRCRAPNRRAVIRRVAANGRVTMRCSDCAKTGHETAAKLHKIRLFLRGNQQSRTRLYEMERHLRENGTVGGARTQSSRMKLRALEALADALGVGY